MHYQFSSFTNRLVGTNNPHALYPISPVPLSKNDPPNVTYANAHLSKVPEKRAMSSAQGGTSTVPAGLLKKMEQFQRKDGLPVFLKGGPVDKVLFGLTMSLCAVGVALSFKVYYDLSYPKKQ
ncbi:cytochrome c oxidase subunit 7A-related protein, mitochondrial-like isoform X1 [Chrysoperla carnea]|uniref:cytochrome c oxidase subunit 7A-related protein, mitochondrial-like isoform X1 n=1 Tax=Chrysoperla carnea TaxID=189513 RepID=UPI001D087316|nr:cytochrome c oxidase subunit 7A-related protein, mitochondrial-like isoform X1 [Chrysoperla carnea]